MTRPRLEVAEIIRSCYDEFLERFGSGLTPQQRRALDDLASCRTAALGGHVLECPQCGHQQIAYNSCGNRHCPKCQGTAAARWLETQAADLLPTPYFHVVFTLPRILGPIALANPRQVYGLLMRAAAETLLELAADPKHLGAKIGVLATLHTWGQNLQLHPHVHCVVTGGGLSLDESHWITGSDELLPALPGPQPGAPGQVPGGASQAVHAGSASLRRQAHGAQLAQSDSTACCQSRSGPIGSFTSSHRGEVPRRS